MSFMYIMPFYTGGRGIVWLAPSNDCYSRDRKSRKLPSEVRLKMSIVVTGAALGGAVVATAVQLCVSALRRRTKRRSRMSGTGTGADAAGVDSGIAGKLGESALASEAAAIKLGTQVGETLAAATGIAAHTGSVNRQVFDLSNQVVEGAAAMEEIHATIESLVRRISQQGTTIQESTYLVEHMAGSIRNVADVAETRSATSKTLQEVTTQGGAAVKTSEAVMSEVSTSLAAVHETIGVIDDIASRTNLLAMNAAIEAAHAGKAGAGFAVVATEIRALAQMTTTNAASITALLKQLTGRIEVAHNASSESRAAFTRIEREVAEVSSAFEEITGFTRELSSGTTGIVDATGLLRDISSEIGGSSEEMRLAAEDLNRVISSARETATATVEAMSAISGASTDVIQAISRIAQLSVETNSAIMELLQRVGEEGAGDIASSRERLRIATLICEHMNWIGMIRLVLEQRETLVETMTVPERTELGTWLLTEAKTVIPDGETYRRLKTRRQSLHETLNAVVDAQERSAIAEREGHFERLLVISREIVEMLTSLQSADMVRWSEDYAVSVRVFDDHHQKLFQLVDKLYQGLQAGTTREDLMALFDELIDYTGYHFAAEEKAFEHFDYPGCDVQKKQHADLVRRVIGLRSDMENGKSMVAVEVMETLRDWLVNHIKGCDKKYAAFFADRDIDAALTRS
ncbi:MAG: hypothetical protein EA383_16825 [Spirochaetaceae bacterium]|nr:MAG: hypothetical protein EA383_16825 [Spirochaetaceae bacterium]